MGVPLVHVPHVDLDDRHLRLHQPPRQEHRLSEHVAAVTIAGLVRFTCNVKRISQATIDEDVVSLLHPPRQVADLLTFSQCRALRVDALQQLLTIGQTPHTQSGSKLQFIDTKVLAVGILDHVPRVVIGPQESGRLTTKSVPVVQVSWQHDPLGPSLRTGSQVLQSRRETWPVVPTGHVSRSGWLLVDPRQHPVRPQFV